MPVTVTQNFRDGIANKGYSATMLAAAQEVIERKDGGRVPGSWDRGGRFWAAERTSRTDGARTPSRAWPYSELKAAMSAAHVAEVYCVDPLPVKRLIRALEDIATGERTESEALEALKRAPAAAPQAVAA